MSSLAIRPLPPFADTPQTPDGHLGLYLYVAAARCADYLRRLARERGEDSDALLGQRSFLARYEQILADRQASDGDPLAALDSWERACDQRLPLHGLERDLGLDMPRRLAFALAGLPEEDSRFGALFGDLQGFGRRPSVELLGRILAPQDLDAWALCRPLIRAGLVEIEDPEAPRAEQTLRIPSLVWDAVRGELGDHPVPELTLRALQNCLPFEQLLYPAEFLSRLERAPRALRQGRARLLLLRHAPGVDVQELAGAVARALGRNLMQIAASAVRERAAGPLLALTNALPLVPYDAGPGETIDPPEWGGYCGPVVLAMGSEGGLRAEKSESTVVLEVPFPEAGFRERTWRAALGETPVDDLGEVRDRFQIAGGYIRTVAKGAAAHALLDGRREIRTSDVRTAGRLLNRQLLDTLAQPVEASGTWDDLVASTMTRDRLAELEQRCVVRERLAQGVGQAFRSTVGRGVRALLAGASGTGKTMAARILAAELGMDLYRVDLAAVVNKYVGETEKNLHLVLSRAEALDVVLLLDEGDSLMGKRSEVKSSNDRYANLETNYLLQRLESYQGIALVTTNFPENIDPAFQRRMDVVVPFFFPRPDERRAIWRLHLPEDHAIDGEWLERVTQRCALTGGQIRNAVLQAASLALETRMPLGRGHLEQALLREYQKAGAGFPLLGGNDRAGESRRGLDAFVAALRSR